MSIRKSRGLNEPVILLISLASELALLPERGTIELTRVQSRPITALSEYGRAKLLWLKVTLFIFMVMFMLHSWCNLWPRCVAWVTKGRSFL
jgi:hypothetical protein